MARGSTQRPHQTRLNPSTKGSAVFIFLGEDRFSSRCDHPRLTSRLPHTGDVLHVLSLQMSNKGSVNGMYTPRKKDHAGFSPWRAFNGRCISGKVAAVGGAETAPSGGLGLVLFVAGKNSNLGDFIITVLRIRNYVGGGKCGKSRVREIHTSRNEGL